MKNIFKSSVLILTVFLFLAFSFVVPVSNVQAQGTEPVTTTTVGEESSSTSTENCLEDGEIVPCKESGSGGIVIGIVIGIIVLVSIIGTGLILLKSRKKSKISNNTNFMSPPIPPIDQTPINPTPAPVVTAQNEPANSYAPVAEPQNTQLQYQQPVMDPVDPATIPMNPPVEQYQQPPMAPTPVPQQQEFVPAPQPNPPVAAFSPAPVGQEPIVPQPQPIPTPVPPPMDNPMTTMPPVSTPPQAPVAVPPSIPQQPQYIAPAPNPMPIQTQPPVQLYPVAPMEQHPLQTPVSSDVTQEPALPVSPFPPQ